MGDWEDDWDESWGRDDLPVLTSPSGLEQTRDDIDVGWGERTWSDAPSADTEDLERFLRDRPPHYGD
ncbi:hypothetical protein KGA66_06240 [Actinocrinis puniceicyclus]|uniref:Uncharacterized protein n=1 Tax=Actinocrinis puniceicyclus TaxID=977794 RepID=A0A8J7WM28_9ACTN|nr:hypothetical protein [Actinocrinis puniceicyclus]MBS2962637.1 hypothetical protein [Actinocrinis puniceicyclus]